MILDDFEQSIEDNAEKFVPLSDAEMAETSASTLQRKLPGISRTAFILA